MSRRLASLMFVIVALTSCSAPDRPVVLAASSLTSAIGPSTALGRSLEVDVVFAGSPSLVAQLEADVSAAVIITADEVTMNRASASGRLGSAPVVIARNRLVLATPPGNPAAIIGLDDLDRPELLVGACAPAVPCGAIANAALTVANQALDADTEETSMRALATKLALGELDVAIVYASEARALGLSIVSTEAFDGFEAVYFAAPISGDQYEDGAHLIDMLLSSPFQLALANAGFEQP